jgi:UDPglucose--hexose-1-phosphate uridylyltransferase
VVPYWAVWPFEVMILPRRHLTQLQEMDEWERSEFAAILQAVTAIYDQIFGTPFPYSMGLHPAHAMESGILIGSFMPTFILPCCGPRRLVGFELLGGPQRDITPESAAEVLRQANARLSASRSA